MKIPSNFRFIGAGFLAIAVVAIVSAAEQNFTLPPETAQLKEGPGQELAMGNCVLCHSADYINTQPRFNRTVWKAEVTKMQQKYGAPIATNNIEALVEYLVKTYGVENPPPPPVKAK